MAGIGFTKLNLYTPLSNSEYTHFYTSFLKVSVQHPFHNSPDVLLLQIQNLFCKTGCTTDTPSDPDTLPCIWQLVKSFLFWIMHCANMMYGGSGNTVPHILTSALDRGKRSVSRPGHFTSSEKAQVPKLVRKMGGTHRYKHSEALFPWTGFKSRFQSLSPQSCYYIGWHIPAPYLTCVSFNSCTKKKKSWNPVMIISPMWNTFQISAQCHTVSVQIHRMWPHYPSDKCIIMIMQLF